MYRAKSSTILGNDCWENQKLGVLSVQLEVRVISEAVQEISGE